MKASSISSPARWLIGLAIALLAFQLPVLATFSSDEREEDRERAGVASESARDRSEAADRDRAVMEEKERLRRELAEAARAQAEDRDRADLEKEEQERLRDELQEAREALREATLRIAEIQREMQRHRIVERRIVRIPTRAGIGIVVRTEPETGEDLKGAAVVALTPGGAAEEAGLRVGDRIVKFQGRDLASLTVDSRDSHVPPARRLVEMARSLEVDEKVTVVYERGEGLHEATLTAKPLGPHRIGSESTIFSLGPKVSRAISVQIDPESLASWTDALNGLLDLEMVSLNPDLGEYFGAKGGVLVVRTPEESPLNVEAGDVLLRIGDEEPRTPQQAVRLLRGSEPGEVIVLQVLRKGNRIQVETKAPGPQFWMLPMDGGEEWERAPRRTRN